MYRSTSLLRYVCHHFTRVKHITSLIVILLQIDLKATTVDKINRSLQPELSPYRALIFWPERQLKRTLQSSRSHHYNGMLSRVLVYQARISEYSAARAAGAFGTGLPPKAGFPWLFLTPSNYLQSHAHAMLAIPQPLNVLKLHVFLAFLILVLRSRNLDSNLLCWPILWCPKSCYRTGTTRAGAISRHTATLLQDSR